MTTLSRLELAPLHRPRSGGKTERWSWDFLVDGKSLHARIGSDAIGALGWGDAGLEIANDLQRIALEPFHFDRSAYGRLLREALRNTPGPEALPLTAF
jgi:hypothetical protein